MEIGYLNSILYLQYNTIAEEAHSHPVCEVFFLYSFRNFYTSYGHIINRYTGKPPKAAPPSNGNL